MDIKDRAALLFMGIVFILFGIAHRKCPKEMAEWYNTRWLAWYSTTPGMARITGIFLIVFGIILLAELVAKSTH